MFLPTARLFSFLQGECILSTNFAFRNHEGLERPGNMFLFITTSILLLLGLGSVVMLIVRSFSKHPTPETAVARGYEKLSNSGGRDIFRGGTTSLSSTSPRYAGGSGSGYGYLHEEQLVDLRDRRTGQNDDDEDDEDEDIVYMGQDGTVYRKFRYGQLGEDQDDQLEYDDESYNFK